MGVIIGTMTLNEKSIVLLKEQSLVSSLTASFMCIVCQTRSKLREQVNSAIHKLVQLGMYSAYIDVSAVTCSCVIEYHALLVFIYNFT